jgi:tetrahydromethanopterin S-methyltransferase subunit G
MNDQSLSFDRMRGMLVRAAELRDSEQQQIFDSLDEIHARLAGLDAIGTVRKRLSELPDRTEVGVLAERLDETVAKLDTLDGVLATIARAIEGVPDKLARPIAALDGRLDGMAGRLEGVSGRMDGLDDRLGGLHKRLDELDTRLDRHEMRLDAMPATVGGPIREKIDGVERMVREQLAGAAKSFDETGEGLRNLLGDATVGLHRRIEELAARPVAEPAHVDGLSAKIDDLATRPAVDPTAALDGLAARLEALTARIDRVESSVGERPDVGALHGLVTKANEESERRAAGHLDEAMATFAELIMGRGVSMPVAPPPPRASTRRTARGKANAQVPNGQADLDV